MAARITKVKAQKVLAAVQKKYASYLEGSVGGPALIEDWGWSGGAPYSIVWEDGPSDWALVATSGDATDEDWALAAEVGLKPAGSKPITVPAGVYAEPITSYALGLYQE